MTLIPSTPQDGIAWITGASSGIGYALALQLAGQGWHVVASARSVDKLNDLSVEAKGLSGKISIYPLDVSDKTACEKAVLEIEQNCGPIALAVFNAGIFKPVYGEDLKIADFISTFNVNLNGIVYGLLPLIDVMKQRKKGQIALVSSVTGYGGLPSSAAYGATKAALINMAESLKFDTDKMGILMQIVNPGFVDTPATRENDFEMPGLVSTEVAAMRILKGLKKGRFEITFPRRFTYTLKILGLLPYPVYFWLLNKITGWKKRPLNFHSSDKSS